MQQTEQQPEPQPRGLNFPRTTEELRQRYGITIDVYSAEKGLLKDGWTNYVLKLYQLMDNLRQRPTYHPKYILSLQAGNAFCANYIQGIVQVVKGKIHNKQEIESHLHFIYQLQTEIGEVLLESSLNSSTEPTSPQHNPNESGQTFAQQEGTGQQHHDDSGFQDNLTGDKLWTYKDKADL